MLVNYYLRMLVIIVNKAMLIDYHYFAKISFKIKFALLPCVVNSVPCKIWASAILPKPVWISANLPKTIV